MMKGGFVVYDYKLRKYDNDERWRVYQGDGTKELTSFVIPKFELKKEYEGVLTEEGLAISMVQMICAGDYLCKKEMMTDEEKEEEKIQRELEQISFLEFAKKCAEYEKIDGEFINE